MLKLTTRAAPSPIRVEAPQGQPSLIWEKCTEAQKSAYSQRLSGLLEQSPSLLSHCSNNHCTEDACLSSIQKEYESIVNQISLADKVIPRHKPGVQKHWWTEELSALKEQNIHIHRLWQSEGKPHSGPTNEERLRVKAVYKKALRAAQKKPKQSCWNRLHGAMASKNTTQFWKSWKQLHNKSKSDLHPVIDDKTSKEDIAASFRTHFEKVSKPNNDERVKTINENSNPNIRVLMSLTLVTAIATIIRSL